MTASSANTAELPVVGPAVVSLRPSRVGAGPSTRTRPPEPIIEPEFLPLPGSQAATVVAPPPSAPAPESAAPPKSTTPLAPGVDGAPRTACRAELRAERRQARRIRRRYAALGLFVLAAALASTVVVLDSFR